MVQRPDREAPTDQADAAHKAKMRIAMVAACPFPANHGTPGAIRELAITLARQGHEVHVVTYPQGDDTPVEGVHIHRVASPFSTTGKITIGPSYGRLVFDMLLVPKLISVIRRHKLNIIHAHNYEAAIAGALAKWLTGKPMVYNGITSMADELPTYRFIRPDSLARAFGKMLDYTVPRTANALIVFSDELKQYLQGLGIAEQKIVVIPPGIVMEDFSGGNGSLIRDAFQLDDHIPLVMYTGALEGFQRLDLLLHAMAEVVRKKPETILMIVNNIPNPKAREELDALAESLGIASQIRYAESVPFSELSNYLAAADVAVVPRSSCPGFPIKLLNYMAAGKAIVVFQGSAKSVCHGYNAYVAENENVDDFAAGICLLLDDKDLRTKLGQRARDSIPGIYDWDTIAKGNAMIYEQLQGKEKRIQKSALARYVKAEYKPHLASAVTQRSEGFLQEGPVEYPSFTSETQQGPGLPTHNS